MLFRELIGHEHLVALLARAVARQTLPPSLIFAGPDGVGKRTTALALGRALNCEAPVDGARTAGTGVALETDACGQCASCRRIARYAEAVGRGARFALDCVVWVRPDEKASIKIDVVRTQVLERVGFRPFDGRRRLVIVDEADALEVAAQQALLKSLEEPPPASAFVLVTARPDALLPTIRSRCPRLRFSALPVADVARGLETRCGFDAAAARALAGVSGGSLGRALARRADEAVGARQVAVGFLDVVAGAGNDAAQRLGAAQWLLSREGGARKGTATRVQIGERLDALASLARDLGLVATRADRRWLANADLAEWTETVASTIGPERAVRAFSTVDRAQVALERNAGFKTLADWLAFHL